MTGGFNGIVMGIDGIIGENNIFAVLEQVKNTKSLIRMKLAGKDYEQLTVIDDIQRNGKSTYLLIGCPNGFAGLIDGASRKIQFEFTGSDKLPYFFDADMARTDQKNIWVLFPEYISRKQLRRDFRVDVPHGTIMVFKKNGVIFKKQVINLSLGGAFGALIGDRNRLEPDWPLCAGDALTGIDLFYRSKLSDQRVIIRKAVVIRCEENPALCRFCCAIHFADMNKSEEKALTELIYVVQRECRLNRLPIAD